jgi:hypothetical protein
VISAFQSTAFQSSAFQVAVLVTPPVEDTGNSDGSGRARGPLPAPAWSYWAPQRKATPRVARRAEAGESQAPQIANPVLARKEAAQLLARLRNAGDELAAAAALAQQVKQQELERQQALMRMAEEPEDDEMAVINAVCLAMTRH